jgi:Family of unknown function (DUF6186)
MVATLATWAVIVGSIVLLETVAILWPDRADDHDAVPTAADLVDLVMRHPVGRWVVLAGWLWLGWHLFVRR